MTISFWIVDMAASLKLWGYRFIRPEPQAFWAPFLGDDEWQNPAGVFMSGSRDQDDGGKWELDPSLPAEWIISYEDKV